MTPDLNNSQTVPWLRRLVAGNTLQKIQRLPLWDLQWSRGKWNIFFFTCQYHSTSTPFHNSYFINLPHDISTWWHR